MSSIYQIIVLELESDDDDPPNPKTLNVTRYYQNRIRWEPYITAEFNASEFDKYETFSVGNGHSFSNERRRRKRSGRTNRVLTSKRRFHFSGHDIAII